MQGTVPEEEEPKQRTPAVPALLIAGTGLALAAFSALRHGQGRTALVSGGFLVLAIAASTQYPGGLIGLIPRALVGRLRESRGLRRLWKLRAGVASMLVVLLALAIYAFFGSAGTWTTWPETSRYYDQLATAIRAGRLSFDVQPPAALLALADPYEPSVRNGVPGLRAFTLQVWDLSFYRGSFYPYWGPAPGLLLAFAKLFYNRAVPDQFLAFGFLAGLLLVSTLLILRARRAFRHDLPAVLTILGVAVAALAYPIPWMLSHAAIYESSIAASQFFLIGGVYAAYLGLENEERSTWKLLLASLLWALAAASRLLALFAVAVILSFTLLWVLAKHRTPAARAKLLPALCALGLPLAVGLAGLGYYNWLRFGSVFETGVRYMLTSINLDRWYSETFMARYAAGNLQLYLLGPLTIKPSFPFVAPRVVAAVSLPPGGSMGIHHVEQMTGLVYALPFAAFSLVAVTGLVPWVAGMLRARGGNVERYLESPLAWLTASLAGTSLVYFAGLLLYYYVAIRFLADMVPSLVILSVLGMWQGYQILDRHPAARRLYTLAAMLLGLISIAVSVFLTMAESYPQFEFYNPHLMVQILRLFAH